MANVCQIWRDVLQSSPFWSTLSCDDLELNSLIMGGPLEQNRGMERMLQATYLRSLQKLDFLGHRDGQSDCLVFSKDFISSLRMSFPNLKEIKGNVEDSFDDDLLNTLSSDLPDLKVLHLISPNITQITDNGIMKCSMNFQSIELFAIKTQKLSEETLAYFFGKHGTKLSYFSFGPSNEDPAPFFGAVTLCKNLVKLDINGFKGLDNLISNSNHLEEVLIDSIFPFPTDRNIFKKCQSTLREVIINNNTDHLEWLELLLESQVPLKSLHIFIESTNEEKLQNLILSFQSSLKHLCITIRGVRWAEL